MTNTIEQTPPTYKVHGNERKEAKFVLDCMRRIVRFYQSQKENPKLLDYDAHFISNLTLQEEILAEKLDEKF
jgi:hypothetical protein